MIRLNALPAGLASLSFSLVLIACGGGGGDSADATVVNGLNSADTTVEASDITAFNFTAVAGYETGLRYLAKIDGRIKSGYRNEVWIDFGNGVRSPGLLHRCGGVAQLTDCEVWGGTTYNLPGVYTYSVTYQPPGVFADPISSTGQAKIVEPGDFVIVSIGDSVASGEGNPVHAVEIPYAAHWDDEASNYVIGDGSEDVDHPCHRSLTAGPAQAARRIASTNDVTFIHIACSGGYFGNAEAGDKNGYPYITGAISKINLQLDWVREHFPRIDVLLLSGGANNVQGGFEQVVTKCVLNDPRVPCSEDETFVRGMDQSIADLYYDPDGIYLDPEPGDSSMPQYQPPGKYNDLDRLIRCGNPSVQDCTYNSDPNVGEGLVPPENQVPTVVAITEYFDPTHDSYGNFPNSFTAGACAALAISPDEWEFLYNHMVVPLNHAGEQAANAFGWTHVGGIANAFRKHGYCAYTALGSPTWVVAIGVSELTQGDKSGTGHPNAAGQDLYFERIYTEVRNANPPRTVATGQTEGQPYEFGTWVATDVEVTLAAYNPIQESGVAGTSYAVDDPQCNSESVAAGACTAYTTPIVVSESGRHTVSFFSTNNYSAAETRAKPVEVLIDKEPPVMTCVPMPIYLWPPNNSFMDVTIAVTADDAVSGPADYVLTGITATEGDPGTDARDWGIGTADTEGSLLAKRLGNGEGRVYVLTYESQDALGNTGTCDAVVTVPHDVRHIP